MFFIVLSPTHGNANKTKRHKMGKLKTKSTNSDPVFYDVSSNHHQNIVNLCLMMNPPFLVGEPSSSPKARFFKCSPKKLKACQVECSEPQHATEGSKLNLPGGFPAYRAPWKIHSFEPQEWRWVVQMIFLFNWVIFYGFHLRFVGGTYPT